MPGGAGDSTCLSCEYCFVVSRDESRALVHWYSRGPGTATVLLHGFTGSAASFDALAARCPGPVCALHLPGHHADAPLPASFAAGVEWVCETLSRSGIDGARLVGYSLGARVALAAAVAHPAMWHSLALISGHPGLEDDDARRARRAADRRWIDILRGAGIASFVDAWQALPLWHSQERLPATARAAQRGHRLAHDPAGLAGSLETMGLAQMPALGRHLGGFRMPVSLIVGGLDEKFLGIARSLARRYRQLTFEVVENAGHNVVLEAPDALAALIWPP